MGYGGYRTQWPPAGFTALPRFFHVAFIDTIHLSLSRMIQISYRWYWVWILFLSFLSSPSMRVFCFCFPPRLPSYAHCTQVFSCICRWLYRTDGPCNRTLGTTYRICGLIFPSSPGYHFFWGTHVSSPPYPPSTLTRTVPFTILFSTSDSITTAYRVQGAWRTFIRSHLTCGVRSTFFSLSIAGVFTSPI